MKKTHSGQSLVELMFAVAIVSLVLIALVSLSTKAISNTTFSKNSSLASRYNQEALEWLRGQRDTDWDTFQARTAGYPTWCLDTLSFSKNYICNASDTIPDTIFLRNVILSHNAGPPESINVSVIVSWVDPSGDHESRSATTLTNWKAD